MEDFTAYLVKWKTKLWIILYKRRENFSKTMLTEKLVMRHQLLCFINYIKDIIERGVGNVENKCIFMYIKDNLSDAMWY